MEEPFRHELRVRVNECDPQGIVFNANYLVFFDGRIVRDGHVLTQAELRYVAIDPATGTKKPSDDLRALMGAFAT